MDTYGQLPEKTAEDYEGFSRKVLFLIKIVTFSIFVDIIIIIEIFNPKPVAPVIENDGTDRTHNIF